MKASENVFPLVEFGEDAAPATPTTGQVRIYAKTDGLMYSLDDAGVETPMGGGTGDVVGPGSATDDNLAVFDGTSGQLIKDGGVAVADLTQNPMTTTGDIIYSSSGSTPDRLGVGSDGEVLTLASGVPTWASVSGTGDVVGPASATDSNLAAFDGVTGKLLKDGGVAVSGLMTNPLTTTGDIIYSSSGTTPARLAAGTSGYVLTSNGAGVAPSWQAGGGGGGAFDPSAESYFCEDFRNGIDTSTNSGTSWLNAYGATAYLGSGTASIGGVAGRPNQVTLSTSSSSSGYSRLYVTQSPGIVPGGGVIRVGANFTLPTLSTSGQRFYCLFGLLDNITGTPSNRIIALYSDNINSGNWQLNVFNSGVSSDGNSSIAPVAGAETFVEIEINAAGTLATLYVDGVSAASVAVTITSPLTLGLHIVKSVGTTARTAVVDYMEFRQTFTTPR